MVRSLCTRICDLLSCLKSLHNEFQFNSVKLYLLSRGHSRRVNDGDILEKRINVIIEMMMFVFQQSEYTWISWRMLSWYKWQRGTCCQKVHKKVSLEIFSNGCSNKEIILSHTYIKLLVFTWYREEKITDKPRYQSLDSTIQQIRNNYFMPSFPLGNIK